jgi:3-oxoacyl-[acyl-carrier protein] reductase
MEKRRVALITGATRGIGYEIALKLAKRGINLALAGRADEKLSEVVEKVKALGVDAIAIKCDLSSELAPQQMIKETIYEYRRIDFLINNAGFAINKSIEETTPEEWDEIMTVNAKAPYFICKEALPALRKSEEGTIINISSVVGRIGYESQSAYAASKHALNGFTKSLAREEQKNNIRVHLIAPGGVATDMVKEMRPDLDTACLIQPDEIAEIVDFIISNRGNAVIDEINVRRASSVPFS